MQQVSEIHAHDTADDLDPPFRLRCADGVSAAAADAEHADPVGVDVGEGDEVVDDEAEVLDPLRGVLGESGFAAAGALVAGVECDDDVGSRTSLGVGGTGVILPPVSAGYALAVTEAQQAQWSW
ncbi:MULTISPECIES: hypothetical protein [unclassified Rhodococcus (in: high G+C Gram-positive bacteria)]|jgi:hypothetical protein|uniref:hypothetical protein n=1 Tax=unclassified Rhodococcus (in: high G+C Gram-positive bacteria) TaxID=192944 RepID=UPI00192BCB4D|nr:hypothetical protein [Rhodococcus sp. DK17]